MEQRRRIPWHSLERQESLPDSPETEAVRSRKTGARVLMATVDCKSAVVGPRWL